MNMPFSEFLTENGFLMSELSEFHIVGYYCVIIV